MRRLILALSLTAGLLGACGRPTTAHDAAYDRSHREARQAEVAGCSTDPGGSTAPECLAALKAAGQAESQRALSYTPPASRVTNAGHL